LSLEQSTFWVTGYVGWTLNLTQITGADLDCSAQWLLDNQSPNGGWGYNCHWPVDTDTIANVIMFLANRPDIEPAQWAPALELLLAHQKPDGGFSTVIDATAWLSRFPPEVDDLNGWTASHPCVTAVTAMLLATLGQGRYHRQAARALAYLCAQQHAAGYWNAYWWTGQFYTTSRAVQAMSIMDDGRFSAHLAKASTWILASQLTDGGWAASNSGTAQSFQTALAVQALCFSTAGARQVAAIRRGVHCLLRKQAMDGSWPAIPMMLLPSPDVLHPWNRDEWNESILGLNVIVPDWHRLFTTATALQALHAAMTHPSLELID
jgi:squalene cyclase